MQEINKIPFFSWLEPSQCEAVLRQLLVRRYKRGQAVMTKGSVGDALGFLLSGSLQVVDYTEDGREIGLRIIAEGDFFGELGLIDGQPRSAAVVAIVPSTVGLLRKEVALQLIYHTPELAAHMMQHLTQSIRRLSEFRNILSINNSNRRVYSFIGTMAGGYGQPAAVIERLPRQRELAIMVNTSRETVSRVLSHLQQLGVVEKDGQRLIIRNPSKLMELAQDGD